MRSGISVLTIIDFGVGVKNDRKIAEWVIGLSRNQRSYNPEMGGRNTPKYANAASYDFTVTAIDGYLANAIVTATCGNQTFTGVTNASGVAQIDTNGIASSNCAIAITAKNRMAPNSIILFL